MQAQAHRLAVEWLHRQCDEVTRRTGYLTKYVRLIDLHGMSIRGINRRFQRRDAENTKAIEDFYPQLLGAVFICHAPRWLQGVWRGLRTMMSARVLEKVIAADCRGLPRIAADCRGLPRIATDRAASWLTQKITDCTRRSTSLSHGPTLGSVRS